MSTSKLKSGNKSYVCAECGSAQSKWVGQCQDCKAWNSLKEYGVISKRGAGYAGELYSEITSLDSLPVSEVARLDTGISELDRVLGGGLVAGSVILLGGDPGIGKSTILLQVLADLSNRNKVLYITGEESLQQVKMRAVRLGLSVENLAIDLLAETAVEIILNLIDNAPQEKYKVIVIDSIQTLFSQIVPSAAGSVSQVRESAALLTRYAKRNGTAMFLVGHVTKEGALAGPRVLEHMVDTVLYFEGQADSRYRLLRAVKNRFGAANELGVFAMDETGLQGVKNPSAIFLSARRINPGSVVMVAWEGTRPFLVEVQALVDETPLANPRRVTLGFDANRLALSLAVLSRHGQISMYNQDVYINIVGGVKISETALDLPILLAVLSSLKNKSLPEDLIVFGEVGLSGEIRPVQSALARLKEAEKHGFKQAIIPFDNAKQIANKLKIIKINPAKNISEAMDYLS